MPCPPARCALHLHRTCSGAPHSCEGSPKRPRERASENPRRRCQRTTRERYAARVLLRGCSHLPSRSTKKLEPCGSPSAANGLRLRTRLHPQTFNRCSKVSHHPARSLLRIFPRQISSGRASRNLARSRQAPANMQARAERGGYWSNRSPRRQTYRCRSRNAARSDRHAEERPHEIHRHHHDQRRGSRTPRASANTDGSWVCETADEYASPGVRISIDRRTSKASREPSSPCGLNSSIRPCVRRRWSSWSCPQPSSRAPSA